MGNHVVYAAGPIDLAIDGVSKKWRESFFEALATHGHHEVLVFDPSRPFVATKGHPGGGSMSKFIEEVNLTALLNADVVVACMPKGVSMVGTPIELDIATRNNKPIVLITDIKYGASVYTDNRVPQDMRSDLSNGLESACVDAVSLLNYVLDRLGAASNKNAFVPKVGTGANFLNSKLNGTLELERR